MFSAYRGLDKLDQEMRKRVEAFLVLCKEAELDILITETWRSKPRQLWLWCKGRVLSLRTERNYLGYDDKNIYSKPRERKVTWTLRSKHQTGEAIDICFKTAYGITYNGDWDKVFDIAEKCGIESLWRTFKRDKPHLQINKNWSPPDTERKARIKGLERQYKIDSDRTHTCLRKWNKTKELLAREKNVVFRPHSIV